MNFGKILRKRMPYSIIKSLSLGLPGPFDTLSVAQYCRSLKEELLVTTVLIKR